MLISDSLKTESIGSFLKSKLSDYAVLVKFRLNLTVVFSAVIGYLFAVGIGGINWVDIFLLSLGGFLVTGSSNAINQILEKDYDRLMKRTKDRPLARENNRMSMPEAVLVAGMTGVIGLSILGFCFNEMTALLGALALLSYAFVYTPLKRISPIAVFVGAIPGALPPTIGWVSAGGDLNMVAYVLFAIQFLWQFPHFWAIGWLGYDDYKKAGYKLLPSREGKGKSVAVQIILYTIILIVVSLFPVMMGLVGTISLIASLLAGLMMLYYGVKLFKDQNDKAALKLMFASIVYLPVMQICMVLDKI